MKRVLLILFLVLLAVSASLYFLASRLGLTKENVLTIISFYLVLNGTILVFTQIRLTLKFNQRKAALDFILGTAMTTLLTYEDQLKRLLNKPSLTFTSSEKAKEYLNTLEPERRVQTEAAIINILSFYERMSIGVLKEGFDEDICYDDRGFMFSNFYGWTSGYIDELRSKHNEPRLYSNAKFLALKWTARMQREKHGVIKYQTYNEKQQIIKNRPIT